MSMKQNASDSVEKQGSGESQQSKSRRSKQNSLSGDSRLTGDSRRAEMMRVARQIVAHRGYSYLTAGTICAEMDVARPLFYHYFLGTEQVAQEIILQQISQFETYVRQWVIQTSSTSMAMCVRRSASVIAQAARYGLIFTGLDSTDTNTTETNTRIPDGNEELIAQYEVALMKRDGQTIAQTIVADARGCSGMVAQHVRRSAQDQRGSVTGASRDEEDLVITIMWGLLSRELLMGEILSTGQISRIIAPILRTIASRA